MARCLASRQVVQWDSGVQVPPAPLPRGPPPAPGGTMLALGGWGLAEHCGAGSADPPAPLPTALRRAVMCSIVSLLIHWLTP